jgi:hypothetical protein
MYGNKSLKLRQLALKFSFCAEYEMTNDGGAKVLFIFWMQGRC